MKKLVNIPIIKVAERCNIRLKHNSAGSEVRCHCPFCGSDRGRPTASLNQQKGLFYCFRCGEGHNAVSLYAKLVGTDNRQAYSELTDIMGDIAA